MLHFVIICHLATGPLWSFRCGLDDEIRFLMNFTQWVDGSSVSVNIAVNDTISIIQPHLAPVTAPDPEPSQSPPMPRRERDREHEPATMRESQQGIEPTIAPEPKPHKMSDQVCEPAMCMTV